jgi:hypothetical protein
LDVIDDETGRMQQLNQATDFDHFFFQGFGEEILDEEG